MILTENSEPLVQVSLYPEKILARSWYFGEGLPGSLPEVWLRASVYDKLILAAEALPENMRLVIWDGWRSFELQSELFNILLARIKSAGIPDNEAYEQAKIFVAIPSKNPEDVSGHLTGGAVDLTIADDKGRYLYMGGNFDEAEEHSYTDYYERESLSNLEKIARDNRRLLVNTMENAGFSNYPSEWWHFDYGNKNWAIRTKAQHAFYGYTEPPFKWR